jgi:hypothetical protein
MLNLWRDLICRSRLAGDAMVKLMPPSLASQLLQGLRGMLNLWRDTDL